PGYLHLPYFLPEPSKEMFPHWAVGPEAAENNRRYAPRQAEVLRQPPYRSPEPVRYKVRMRFLPPKLSESPESRQCARYGNSCHRSRWLTAWSRRVECIPFSPVFPDVHVPMTSISDVPPRRFREPTAEIPLSVFHPSNKKEFPPAFCSVYDNLPFFSPPMLCAFLFFFFLIIFIILIFLFFFSVLSYIIAL